MTEDENPTNTIEEADFWYLAEDAVTRCKRGLSLKRISATAHVNVGS
jgi:predicted DNA-binding protein